jgi:hypothetical protein
MTPATGAALGLPVFHGSGHNPPAFNTVGDELFDWQFVPNPSKK